MQTRMAGLTDVGTLASGKLYAAIFELMRGDYRRAAPNAFELARLAREHELPMFRAFGVFLEGSARAESGTLGSGLEDMRRGAELLREQNVLLFDGLLKIALAEAEARAGDPGHAIAILDEALAMSDRTGLRAFEAELHRTRGEILLKRDPANPAPAEEAFGRQSPSRDSKARAASNCAPRWRSPSSINRTAVPPKPTASSRRPSKAFRRRPSFRRSVRRRRCYRDCRRSASGNEADFLVAIQRQLSAGTPVLPAATHLPSEILPKAKLLA